MYDVTIVGGGITGCAIAHALARFDLRILLVERECEVGFGTSKANSGIIHAGHHASPQTLKGRLEWAGNQVWGRLASELGIGLRRVGELTVALSADAVPTLERLKRQGEQKGVVGLEIWDRDRVLGEEPNLTEHVVAALHAPTSAVVNPYEACFGLADAARRNGVEFAVEEPVLEVVVDHDAFVVVTARRAIHSRFVINAAGLYADRVDGMVGAHTFTIHPRKGEEYLLDKRLVGLVRRTIFPCPSPASKGVLVIPTYDGTIMVGPTAQDTDDREDLATSQQGADEVFAAVRRLVPGISERDCIAAFAGLRAVADTDDFVIGPTAMPVTHYLCIGCPLGCRLEVEADDDGQNVEIRGGDVIMPDALGTGVDVVATRDMPAVRPA
jgi:glycerol-3-phosphate dehydrogenase